jgi:hypothetical protein
MSFKWDPGSASLSKLERPELATVKDTHGQDKMTDRRQIHWFGITSMSVSLLAGIGFALGQHFFYTSLHGKQVPQGNYEMVDVDFGVSEQQVNTAIGTAFAFAVKSCLVLAVSTAYYTGTLADRTLDWVGPCAAVDGKAVAVGRYDAERGTCRTFVSFLCLADISLYSYLDRVPVARECARPFLSRHRLPKRCGRFVSGVRL